MGKDGVVRRGTGVRSRASAFHLSVRAHLPSNTLELVCMRTSSEVCVFPSLCAELTGVTAPFHARDALELLESSTKVRRKRAPVAELESSANPQPGVSVERSADF